MEAAVANFHSPGETILVVDGGKFGERFWRIGLAYGLEVQRLKVKYGEAVSPAEIETAVQKNSKIKSVCLQLCETSTGVVFDLEEIGRRLKEKGPLLIVDAISGLAADRFEMDPGELTLRFQVPRRDSCFHRASPFLPSGRAPARG